jgi:hypothetical protein
MFLLLAGIVNTFPKRLLPTSYDFTQGLPFDSWVSDLLELLPSATYLIDRFDFSPKLDIAEDCTKNENADGK